MKICVSGKGGVGKTLVCAALARLLAKKGLSVWAIDADPDANLALALGIDDADITPLAQMRQLIKERTGAQDGWGAIFKMNPEVADIPAKLSYKRKKFWNEMVARVKDSCLISTPSFASIA